MVVYNETFVVDLKVHEQWLDWMKTSQIPAIMNTGFFTNHRVFRLMTNDQRDGFTYAVQFEAESMGSIIDYQKDALPKFTALQNQSFKDSCASFVSFLKEV